jgi:hypothetical protein
MWTRIALMSWWARALTAASPLAVVVAAGWCARGLADDPPESWQLTLAKHVASIAIFGLFAAACTTNLHKDVTNALVGLDAAQRTTAIDASLRGPVPEDARVRDAAIKVAGCRIYSSRSWRIIFIFIVLGAGVAVATDAWQSWHLRDWINAAAVLGVTATAWHECVSAQRRINTLRHAAPVWL